MSLDRPLPAADGWDAFLSYRRGTAAADAKRTQRALEAAGLRVFIDERDIPLDAEFPKEIADALLDSRILIAFLDLDYFKSQWCLYELQVALAPLRRNPTADTAHVLPVLIGDDVNAILAHLPPSLATSSCSSADPDAILRRVQARLPTLDAPIANRLAADDHAVRALRLGGAVPPPESLTQIPGLRSTMPLSLKHRFQGRALDLWTVFHELATVPADAAPRSCCVAGLPGIGKSQLAAEFAWRYGRRYFVGGIVWIDAGADAGDAAKQIADALAGLHGSALGGLTPQQVLQRACAAGPVLWIIDGLGAADVNDDLDVWCPVRGDVTLLCTSRGARPIDVDVSIDLAALSEVAAVDLLTGPGVHKAALDDASWRTIARWVGCVPQALEVQHAVLKSGFREPRQLLAAAERRASPVAEIDRQFSELRGRLPLGSIAGISETFTIWYERLRADRELLKAAHMLARSHGNALMAGIVSRAAFAGLAALSWLQRVEDPGCDPPRESWRMNDLIRSYLLDRSPDSALDVIRLARAFLGFDPGRRTIMVGVPRGGLDLLANVKSLGAESLDDVALQVLERAVSSPDNLELAEVAEVLGALRNETARARLAEAMLDANDSTWPLMLYLRYVQGFEKAPSEPKVLSKDGGKLVLAAETLMSSPIAPRERQILLDPLLAVLRDSPAAIACPAAGHMARIPITRGAVEAELLRLAKTTPERAEMLAAFLLGAEIESAAAYTICGLSSLTASADEKIECFREAVRLDASMFAAHVALARMVAEQERAADVEAPRADQSALKLEDLSVALPDGWTHKVERTDRGSTLVAHPAVAAGAPPINLVLKWGARRGAAIDQLAIDYLAVMSTMSQLEDLAVRHIPEWQGGEAFLIRFGMHVKGRTIRQHTLVLRGEQQDVSASVTDAESSGASPEMIEALLFSIRSSASRDRA